MAESVFCRIRREVFFDHQSYFEYDRIFEFTQIESGDFFDLFQTVNERIAVNEELAGGFGNVEVVLKELLNRKERFMVEQLDRSAFENLLEKHFAERGRQLIDQPRNSEVVIADNGFFRIENLSDLEGDLGFLKGTGKIADAGDERADSDDAMGIELAGKRIDDRIRELLKRFFFEIRFCLFYEGDIVLVDADHEILVFIREKILDDVVNGNVVAAVDLDDHADARRIGIEMELSCLNEDITGQDIIEDHVFDKVRAIVFFIVILLDIRERNRKNVCVLDRIGIASGNENGIFRTRIRSEGFIGVAVDDKRSGGSQKLYGNVFVRLSDSAEWILNP